MDKMIIICDIGVNPKTGSVYKIPIVDSDHIHILNTVGNRLLAGSEKIIPRTDGKKRKDRIGSCQVVQDMVDRPISPDCCDDVSGIPISPDSGACLFGGFIYKDFKITFHFPGDAVQPLDHKSGLLF